MTNKTPLRFAFLSQTWPADKNAVIAGSSVQVYYMAKELASRGYPVLVILSSPINFEVSYDIPLSLVSVSASRGLVGQLNPKWLKKIKTVLHSFKPDVIYQRGKLPESVAACCYARESSTCFVWLSNSDNSGERWKFVKKRWAKRHKFLTLAPRLIEALYADILVERAIRKANIVIAQTKYQQERLLVNFGLKAVILKSGHPIPEYQPRQLRTPRILWLANLTPMKRPHLFAELAKRLSDLNAQFIMAGRAQDKNILARVRYIASGLKNFFYIGGVSLDEANNLMRDADMFVLTSEYEGIANTFIQACIHAVPTISLGHDPDGIISMNNLGEVPKTLDDLVETVRIWASDEVKRKTAGLKAYEFAKRELNIKRIVDKFIILIEKSAKLEDKPV